MNNLIEISKRFNRIDEMKNTQPNPYKHTRWIVTVETKSVTPFKTNNPHIGFDTEELAQAELQKRLSKDANAPVEVVGYFVDQDGNFRVTSINSVTGDTNVVRTVSQEDMIAFYSGVTFLSAYPFAPWFWSHDRETRLTMLANVINAKEKRTPSDNPINLEYNEKG